MKHKINTALAALLLFSAVACRTETQSVSAINGKAIGAAIANNSQDPGQIDEKINHARYKANITNLLSELPSISADINPQVNALKKSIEQYLASEKPLQEEQYKKYMDHYKAVQNKMYLLNATQQEFINRYLVPIKTNMSLLKSSNDLIKSN
jgi:Skp family chaperone for outer membrane proteins